MAADSPVDALEGTIAVVKDVLDDMDAAGEVPPESLDLGVVHAMYTSRTMTT